MSRPSSLSPDNILRFLQVTRDGASLDGIQRGLQLKKSDRRPLVRMLAKLKKRKAITEVSGGRFVLAARRDGGLVERARGPETGTGAVGQTARSSGQERSPSRNSL